MSRTDYSYIGSGRILARIRGSAAPFRELGNCSALSLGVEQETKRLRDFRSPGGGTYNQVDRITGVTLNVTAHDLSPDNVALALYGTTAAVAGATITDEEVAAYVGGYALLASQAASITAVKDAATGLITYDVDDDFVFQHGGLYLPVGSAIDDPVDTETPNIKVTYETVAGDLVQALAGSAEELELQFLGLNEADSGSPVTVTIYRGKFAAAQSLALIGDDYAALEMSGAVLADASKTGNLSQYFTVFVAG